MNSIELAHACWDSPVVGSRYHASGHVAPLLNSLATRVPFTKYARVVGYSCRVSWSPPGLVDLIRTPHPLSCVRSSASAKIGIPVSSTMWGERGIALRPRNSVIPESSARSASASVVALECTT
jgi:hypothetical protein